jgi:hypothetical protein
MRISVRKDEPRGGEMTAILDVIKLAGGVFDLIKNENARVVMRRYGRVILAVAAALCAISALHTFAFGGRIPDVTAVTPMERSAIEALRRAMAGGDRPFRTAVLNDQLRLLTHTFAEPDVMRIDDPLEVKRVAMMMIDFVDNQMLATTADLKWWQSRSGEKYQLLNTEASKRKHIVRYFRYATPAELKAWLPTLNAQKNAHIEVWTAPLKDDDELADYVIVDHKFAGKLILAPNHEPVRAEFYFAKDKVDEIARVIDGIERTATQF